MRPIEECDPVVLPSGRRAVVLRRLEDGRLECNYVDAHGRPISEDLVSLLERYLRRIEPGRPLPPPARWRRLA